MAVPLGDTEPYYDLGDYHRPVDTPSPQAQVWFDRGLVWAYAFNHEEAIRCFERALALDADLAIARWGIAYAIGPNYNKAWDAFDPVDLAASLARARMELGLAANGRADVVERGLIAALAARFPTDDPDDTDALAAGHTAYADAMAELAEAHPDDVDVLALAADALVNVTAWALWDTATGEPAPGSRVVQAKRVPGSRADHRYRPGPSRRAAPLHPCDGDVRAPRGGAARRRPAARPGPRRRPPRAHALAHRRAVRGVPVLGAGQPVGGPRRPPVRRTRRAAELLLAVPGARPALRGVLRDVRRAVADRADRPPTSCPGSSPPSCCPSSRRRWPTGWRPSSRCGSTC